VPGFRSIPLHCSLGVVVVVSEENIEIEGIRRDSKGFEGIGMRVEGRRPKRSVPGIRIIPLHCSLGVVVVSQQQYKYRKHRKHRKHRRHRRERDLEGKGIQRIRTIPNDPSRAGEFLSY
jgi:hypothetical protein